MPCTRTDKVKYSTEGEARRAIRAIRAKGNAPTLRVYPCDGGQHFHISRQADGSAAWTPQTSTGPKSYVPSAANLRRKLENAGREIAALDKRLAKAEQKRADENLRIAHQYAQVEYETELELQHISELVARIQRV